MISIVVRPRYSSAQWWENGMDSSCHIEDGHLPYSHAYMGLVQEHNETDFY
jgi:hypothetical protein